MTTPEEVQKWIPIIRDFVTLIGGFLIGIAGLWRSDAALTMAGFGIAAGGAIGRVSQSTSKDSANSKDSE